MKGLVLRKKAEKSFALCEFFIELTMDAGDLLFDGFAGTGIAACVAEKLGMRYFGTEIDYNVYTHALIRMMKFSFMTYRGDFKTRLKMGVPKSAMAQVVFCVLFSGGFCVRGLFFGGLEHTNLLHSYFETFLLLVGFGHCGAASPQQSISASVKYRTIRT